MQAAGDESRARDGEGRADKGMEAERVHEPVDERAEGAHARADDREGPAGTDEVGPSGGLGVNKREPRQEG
jgi:hypothetical protein